jgi:hypothetical protein
MIYDYLTSSNTSYVPSYGTSGTTYPYPLNTTSGVNSYPHRGTIQEVVPHPLSDIDWEDLRRRVGEQIDLLIAIPTISERIALGPYPNSLPDKPVLRKPLRMIRLREDAKG